MKRKKRINSAVAYNLRRNDQNRGERWFQGLDRDDDDGVGDATFTRQNEKET